MNTEETRKKYYKYKDFLLDELMYIDSMFDLYIYIKNQHVERIDILNISPAFFGLTEIALLENSSIRLSCLFDSDKKSVTLKKFLNFVEQNRKVIFKAENQVEVLNNIRQDNVEFDEFNEKFLSLKGIRDTGLAHNDYCKLKDNFDMWDGKNIVIGDIHAMIKFGTDVINHYTHYSDNKTHLIKATNKLDVENIFKILEKNKI